MLILKSCLFLFINKSILFILHIFIFTHPDGKCEMCLIPDDVAHFLYECKKYDNQRMVLKDNLQRVGVKKFNTECLLGGKNLPICEIIQFVSQLDSFQKACNKVLKEKEKTIKDNYTQNPYMYMEENPWLRPVTDVLVSCFTMHQLLSGRIWQIFWKSVDLIQFNTKSIFQGWVASKFNILFKSAKEAYSYAPSILHFLLKVSLNRNQVSWSIMNFLKEADCKIHCAYIRKCGCGQCGGVDHCCLR